MIGTHIHVVGGEYKIAVIVSIVGMPVTGMECCEIGLIKCLHQKGSVKILLLEGKKFSMSDPADPVTGLTWRQKEAVRESWGKLSSEWKTHGVEFFIRLFKTYPSILAYFNTFDGMDFGAIRSSPKLRAHMLNFKHGITSFVDSLDDVECLAVLIQKMTETHFRRQITVNEFQDAFTLFATFIQEVTQCDDITLGAWKATLKVISTVIRDHMALLQSRGDVV
ncbi:hemoglobin-3-like isoform X6 [Dreissena polymorpha]|uniref:hemoglobin-3-like isoform X6 n=1 Tax=Dreissena polymorpha TaxID=45954 RepID=UPI002264D1D2|nr:hemoglobin-3-like isoform X6 [Dreissena polymorpha]